MTRAPQPAAVEVGEFHEEHRGFEHAEIEEGFAIVDNPEEIVPHDRKVRFGFRKRVLHEAVRERVSAYLRDVLSF